MSNVRRLGQVFTPSFITEQMLAMRQNFGRVLEPAAGDGAFLRALGDTAIGIEIDPSYAAHCGARCLDFFDYSMRQKFDTIIGNPPYVRHQDIPRATRQKLDLSLFDRRSNLYLFFIAKCLHHLRPNGEMIFITPRDFIKATAAVKLNQLLYDCGTITDFIDLGDAKIFAEATPNCAIWRFVKGDFSRRTNNGRQKFIIHQGQIVFAEADYTVPFSDVFFVKVGAISGMDAVFTSDRHGNRDFIYSQTAATGKTRKMIYNLNHPFLRRHKDALSLRRIRAFDKNNWWQWGRAHYQSDLPRVYVNAKTRRLQPFFLHSATAYDGSVLAIFPHHRRVNLATVCDDLNRVAWEELGFICGGRFLFAQRSLQNCLLPENFRQYLPPRFLSSAV